MKAVDELSYEGFCEMYDKGWRECQNCGKMYPKRSMAWTKDCHGIVFRFVCPDCYDKLMAKGYDGEYYTEADEQIEPDY